MVQHKNFMNNANNRRNPKRLSAFIDDCGCWNGREYHRHCCAVGHLIWAMTEKKIKKKIKKENETP